MMLFMFVLPGILSIRQQLPPILNYKEAEAKIGRDVPDIAKRTALNDCFLRNMYRYEFIAILDLDEIIIPTHDIDYAGLLRHAKPCKVCKGEKLSQMYRSHMFCHYENDTVNAGTNSSGTTMKPQPNVFSSNASANLENVYTSSTSITIESSTTLKNHCTRNTNNTLNVFTTPATPTNSSTSTKIQATSSLTIETRSSYNVMKAWHIPKTLINPRLCAFTWAHGCIMNVRDRIPLHVKDAKSAHVHHYRTSCSLKRYAPHSEDTNVYVEDKHMQRYRDDVRKRVANVRIQLGLD